MDNSRVIRAALRYAERGWKVFPAHGVLDGMQCTCGRAQCSDSGKHPACDNGVSDATDDEKRIHELFNAAPAGCNIALATGAVSGITVLDIDTDKGGAETWANIIDGIEPNTLTANTGGGGLHFVFNYNAALNTSSNTLGQGVDCRNDGGYIIVAPSQHRSGGQYEWADWSVPLNHLPQKLLQKPADGKRGRPRKGDPTKRKYTIEEVAEMLDSISPDDRDIWRKVGIILGREFGRSDAAWLLYNEWSDRWTGKKGRGHEGIMREAFYEISTEEGDLSLGTIVHLAIAGGWAPTRGGVSPEQFIYHAPGNNFIYRSTGAFWPAASVNAVSPQVNADGRLVVASEWLKENRAVTSMTNDPSLDGDFLEGVDCCQGQIIEAPGAAVYNAYKPSIIPSGDAGEAKPFLDHVFNVFNKEGDADAFLKYMAHRVQKPGEKPRFALLIAGEQGVGKDTAIAMCHPAIGIWNVANIDPVALDQAFNEYAASVLVTISEAANLHEMSRWTFNERIKTLIAGTPDWININPKYGQKYSVRMHCGVIITTNHMLTGIHIPADDRRYDVIEAATKAEMGILETKKRDSYFSKLWSWFSAGGDRHVAALLREMPLVDWSPSMGQRITDAHRMVVGAGLEGDSWIREALDALNWPELVRADTLYTAIVSVAADDPLTRKEFNQRATKAMVRCDYTKYHNPNSACGRWKIDGKQTVVYRRVDVSLDGLAKKVFDLKAVF